MINQAMFPPPPNELNPFTIQVKSKIEKDGCCLVKLRNGTFVEVYYKQHDENDAGGSFHTKGWSACWNFNGSSVTRPDFDMIEATFS